MKNANEKTAKATPIATPKKRTEKPSGRDEMLSEYLASLGQYPLLTAEEEIDLAKRLLECELASWDLALSSRYVLQWIASHPIVGENRFLAHVELERLRTVAERTHAPLFSTRIQKREAKHFKALALSLRESDADRNVIAEMIDALRTTAEGDEAMLDIVAELDHLRRKALNVRNKFVRSNLRLVVSVARRFHHYRLPLIDLIQEGNIGLIKGVHRYDHTKGFRFSTYAHWWIRQSVERAIMNKGTQVRLPVHIFDARREVAKTTRDLAQMLNRDPTHEELSVALNIPVEKLYSILKAIPRDPISLDDTVRGDDERTLGETIPDDAIATDEQVIRNDTEENIKRILAGLSPMEVDIIKRRFGLECSSDETLEEIGKSYNLSRERIRQIQVQGIKKIQRVHAQRYEVAFAS